MIILFTYCLFTVYKNWHDLGDIFIGYTDEANEGTWEWTDGGNSPFENWDIPTQQPNNGGGAEDCAVMVGSGTWHDFPCRNVYNYVCQKCPWGKRVQENGGCRKCYFAFLSCNLQLAI